MAGLSGAKSTRNHIKLKGESMHPIEEKLNDFTKRFQGDIELETDLFIYCQRPRIQKERDTGSPLHFLNISARMEQAGAK